MSEFENSNGKQKFVSNLSISLGIDMSSIEIKSIRSGSVIIDYTISADKESLESIKTKQ